MAHDRKLVLGGVGLTLARIPAKLNGAALNRVRDELEMEIVQSGFLDSAPFRWVGVIIRYGLVDETKPHFKKINSTHGDLPLAIEIDVHRMLGVSEDEMARVQRKATLIALVAAGEKYNLPVERLKKTAVGSLSSVTNVAMGRSEPASVITMARPWRRRSSRCCWARLGKTSAKRERQLAARFTIPKS